jgi:hypothetical protein
MRARGNADDMGADDGFQDSKFGFGLGVAMRKTSVPVDRLRCLRRLTWTLLVAAVIIPLPARSAMLVDRVAVRGRQHTPHVVASVTVARPVRLQVAAY